MRINPTENFVFLKTDVQDKTAGGIVLPDTAQEKYPDRGQVAATGPVVDNLSVGDIVMFHPRVGTKFTVDGVEYLALRAPEIQAILEPK